MPEITLSDLASQGLQLIRDVALGNFGDPAFGPPLSMIPLVQTPVGSAAGASAAGGCCPTGPRLAPAVIVNNPCTGAPHVYKNMGAVSSGLFSGDFRAHKRVNKLAAKAARGRPRRKRK